MYNKLFAKVCFSIQSPKENQKLLVIFFVFKFQMKGKRLKLEISQHTIPFFDQKPFQILGLMSNYVNLSKKIVPLGKIFISLCNKILFAKS